jgi:hypothetical protein
VRLYHGVLLLLLLQDNSAHKVAETILGPRNKAVLYAKHMAKHKIGLNQSLMQRSQHMVGHDAPVTPPRPACRPERKDHNMKQ